jgi:hypothetical protein
LFQGISGACSSFPGHSIAFDTVHEFSRLRHDRRTINQATTFSPARSTNSRNAPSALQHIRQAVTAEIDDAASASTSKPATVATMPVLTSAPTSDDNPITSAGFTTAQLAALSAPLDRSRISSREQGLGKACQAGRPSHTETIGSGPVSTATSSLIRERLTAITEGRDPAYDHWVTRVSLQN